VKAGCDHISHSSKSKPVRERTLPKSFERDFCARSELQIKLYENIRLSMIKIHWQRALVSVRTLILCLLIPFKCLEGSISSHNSCHSFKMNKV
jgi:hypothetical protein